MNNENYKELEINGQNYKIGKLPGFKGMLLFWRVMAVTGSSLAVAFSSIDGLNLESLTTSALNSKIDFSKIFEAMRDLASSLYINDKDGKMVLEVLSQTRRNEIPLTEDVINRVLAGEQQELMQALYESVKVHIVPFFPIDNLGGLANMVSSQKALSTPR